MQENIAQKPIISTKKVYLIIDSDCMTKEAGNCLLKTLEEPPEYVSIILTAVNESKLLNTIKSRCMKISFNPIEEKEIYLKVKELTGGEPEKNLISKSGGSIARAVKMQEDKDIYIQTDKILENMLRQDLIDIFNSSEVLYKEKEKIEEILEYITVCLYSSKELKKMNCIKYVEEAKRRIIANGNFDMCIDYLLLNMHKAMNS